MKPLSDMTHYEVLELNTGAGHNDVERAYRIVRGTFDDDSLATYSVYDESEVSAIRERIEQAYRVLSQHETREDYDAGLGEAGEQVLPRIELNLDFEPEHDAPEAEVAAEIEEFADLEAPDEGVFDGAR